MNSFGETSILSAAQDLPRQVLPIYEFAQQTNPYAVIVCDRDARPIGAALEAMRGYTNGLPSVENRWFYRRISKRVPTDELVEHPREPFESLQDTPDGARLMVIDDYVSNSAGTLHLFRGICHKLGMTLPVDWVTLSGKGTAFNALPHLGATPAALWRDRADVIGVTYDGTRISNAPTALSAMFYAAIREGVQKLFEDSPTE